MGLGTTALNLKPISLGAGMISQPPAELADSNSQNWQAKRAPDEDVLENPMQRPDREANAST
jgi:hypothetical protein